MYLDYWKLTKKPFENTPDPAFLYLSSQHEEALSRLLYVVREGKGLALLTGVFGCGKTLISRALNMELEKNIYRVAFITNPRMGEIELLRLIAHSLGAPELPSGKADILIVLEKLITNNWRDKKKTVIVIDEAHSIEDPRVFEEIRLLLNFQLEDRFLVSIILIGQPELNDKLESNKQLSQRIAIRYQLDALSAKETGEYIKYRMNVAGAGKEIFTPDAVNLLYLHSGGIPRRINLICDMSLMVGYSKARDQVDMFAVQEAIDSLGGGE